MRVLMLESRPGAADGVFAELRNAGHTIVRCDTDRSAPCRGLASGGSCPLDEHVDAAVLVQEYGNDELALGAVCAARSRVPIVEVGPMRATPRCPTTFWRSVAATSVVPAVQRAAHDGRAHARAVENRLLELGLLTLDDLEGPYRTVVISVEREPRRLQLTFELADSLRDQERRLTRPAMQALRDFDRGASVIDVVVRPLD